MHVRTSQYPDDTTGPGPVPELGAREWLAPAISARAIIMTLPADLQNSSPGAVKRLLKTMTQLSGLSMASEKSRN